MPAQRKAPFRPRQQAEVSQAYNDGKVIIYDVTSDAPSGFLPSPVLTVKATLAYQERRLSFKRYYDARQNQIKLERVIRVPKPAGTFLDHTQNDAPVEITTQDFARTEDNKVYRIDLVQSVPDVYPPSLDLTLAVYEQRNVEIPDENDLGDQTAEDQTPEDPPKEV